MSDVESLLDDFNKKPYPTSRATDAKENHAGVGVDKLLNAANGFNQFGNYYDPFWGPTSNSAANYLGAAGGFDGGWNTGFGGPIAIPSPGPPGAVAWNTGVMP